MKRADAIARLFEEARAATLAEDLKHARSAYAKIAKLDPTNIKGWINYGAVVAELGATKEALRAFKRALRIDPDSRDALSNLSVLAREAGDLDESQALCRRVIELDPEFVFGHYNLGHTLFLAADFGGAVTAYAEGLKRDSRKTANQRARYAWALMANGDEEAAERELSDTLTHLPVEETDAFLAEAGEVLAALAVAIPVRRAAVHRLQAVIQTWARERSFAR